MRDRQQEGKKLSEPGKEQEQEQEQKQEQEQEQELAMEEGLRLPARSAG